MQEITDLKPEKYTRQTDMNPQKHFLDYYGCSYDSKSKLLSLFMQKADFSLEGNLDKIAKLPLEERKLFYL